VFGNFVITLICTKFDQKLLNVVESRVFTRKSDLQNVEVLLWPWPRNQ